VARALRGAGRDVPLKEIEEVLLPLSRLLHLHVEAARRLAEVQDSFLGRPAKAPPYVLAVAGSVAVGKSTFARLLQAALARWPDHSRVQIVTTDGFLHPNRVLEERGLMERKGFPESYDLRGMIAFLRAVKAGTAEVKAPVYSHLAYDIQPGEVQEIRRPDILIFEGLNVLQTPRGASVAASEFFDYSVYLDANEADIERWFLDRVLRFRDTAFRDPGSYFHHVSRLSPEEAMAMAREVWRDINGPNLRENIAPTKARARLVLTKGSDHAVREVALRRV
jgi:type I pantothenate kinase